MLRHALTSVSPILLIGLSVAAFTCAPAWGADAAGAETKADLASEYLPFIIGGTVLFAIVGVGCLLQLGKRSARSETAALDVKNAPLALPAMSNPLAKLAVPVLLAIGVGVGAYFTFSAAADSFENSAKIQPTPLTPVATPVFNTTVSPQEIQPIPVYAPTVIHVPPPAPPTIPQVIVPKVR